MSHRVIFIGESGVGKSHIINVISGSKVAEVSPDDGLDEITSKVTVYDDKYIDTPGFNGSKYTTFVSDIKKVVKDNKVLIVLVVRHDLTRVTDWIVNVKDLLDHFVNAKLVIIWNSKYLSGITMSESLNKKFQCPLIHLDSSEEKFVTNFNIVYNNHSLLTKWKADNTKVINKTSKSNITTESKTLSPKIKFEKLTNQTNSPPELKIAVKKLCDLHDSNRQVYDDLKVIGDADLRHLAARYLQSKNMTPIDSHLRQLISNDGNMVKVYEEFISSFMISGTGSKFWENWENHKKCDFVEALIAFNFGHPTTYFILSKIGIKY